MSIKKLAIAGCGKLAEIVADAVISGLLPDYRLVGVWSRTQAKAKHLADKIQSSDGGNECTACSSLEELLALKPDYLVESASPSALKELALPTLRNGTSIVTLSIGALADSGFYEEVINTARETGTRVHLVPGAIGGFDVLRTASLMGNCTASIDTQKGPDSLKGTAIYDEALQTETRRVFEGSAIEAIALFPTKVNVAVAASLASVGPEAIKVSVTSTPGYIGDNHRVEISNDRVHAVIEVYSETSEIAGWSVVNTLRNITSPIAF